MQPARTVTAKKIQLHSRSFLMARISIDNSVDRIMEVKFGMSIINTLRTGDADLRF